MLANRQQAASVTWAPALKHAHGLLVECPSVILGSTLAQSKAWRHLQLCKLRPVLCHACQARPLKLVVFRLHGERQRWSQELVVRLSQVMLCDGR